MNTECEQQDEEVCESMEDKMHKCTHLAFQIAYSELSPRDTYFTTRDLEECGVPEEDRDDIWCWVDGLYQKWFFDRLDGHCSLQAMIDFDIAKEEERMDRLIEKWTELSERLGPPVKLTPEEMTKRGYRGY